VSQKITGRLPEQCRVAVAASAKFLRCQVLLDGAVREDIGASFAYVAQQACTIGDLIDHRRWVGASPG
jgi:hypothetical protein